MSSPLYITAHYVLTPLDIDECLYCLADCEQLCDDMTPVFNNTGSPRYNCSCRSGYTLLDDGVSCNICKLNHCYIHSYQRLFITELGLCRESESYVDCWSSTCRGSCILYDHFIIWGFPQPCYTV